MSRLAASPERRSPRGSGGITPDNVQRLLAHEPWGIDVSSGVESVPGHKDPAKLRDLFATLRSDCEVVR